MRIWPLVIVRPGGSVPLSVGMLFSEVGNPRVVGRRVNADRLPA